MSWRAVGHGGSGRPRGKTELSLQYKLAFTNSRGNVSIVQMREWGQCVSRCPDGWLERINIETLIKACLQ